MLKNEFLPVLVHKTWGVYVGASSPVNIIGPWVCYYEKNGFSARVL
jgi:hypothetical protein